MRLASDMPERIDLLITDVVMPGMSGPELAEQLTAARPNLLVLFLSGYTEHPLIQSGKLGENTRFLPKPFLPSLLIRRVDDLLSLSAGARAIGRSAGV